MTAIHRWLKNHMSVHAFDANASKSWQTCFFCQFEYKCFIPLIILNVENHIYIWFSLGLKIKTLNRLEIL